MLSEINKVKAAIPGIGEQLFGVFQNSFRNLGDFTDPLLDGVQRLVESFASLTDTMDPIWTALGGVAKQVLYAVAGGLESLSDNSTEGAVALGQLGVALEWAIDFVFAFVNALTEVYGWGLKLLSVFGHSGATKSLDQFKNSTDEATPSLMDFAEVEEDTEQKTKELVNELKTLNNELFEASGNTRSAVQAQIDFRDALADAKDTIKDSNKVIDEENEGLIRVADSADNLTESLMANGASNEEIQTAIANSKDKFIEMAVQMGYTKEAAADLADDFITFPDLEAYAKLQGIEKAKQQADDLAEYLHDIPDETINLIMRTRGVSASRAAADYAKQYRASGGPIGAAASGGGRNGLTWVGELGPELVRLPFGSSVMTNGDSQRAMRESGGGGDIQIVISSKPGDPWKALIDGMMPHFQWHVKRKGRGDVNYLVGK